MAATEGIIWLDETDSTNDEARRRSGALANLSVVAAKCQRKGRGQGDHTWTSPPGEGLTFTWLLRFPPLQPLSADEILLLTQATTRGVREYLRSQGVEARIKWPNDLWVGERKICGILIENRLAGKQVRESYVGIGLNLNQASFPADLPNPVSLRLLTGKRYDLQEELPRLREHLNQAASLLETAAGRTELDRYFSAYVFRREE